MRIAAVVCHFRRPGAAIRLLGALASQTRAPARVVVVDNASGDGSPERLREAAPWAEVLEAPANRGYAAAVNLGVGVALDGGTEAVALFTHEVHPAPDALEVLAGRLQAAPRVGVVGPLLVWGSDPGRVWSAGGSIDPHTFRPGHVNTPAESGAWRGCGPRAVDWLDGAFLLVRRDVFGAVGGMDERYFLYYEEVDFCLRVRAAGWRIECVPAAVASQEGAGMPVYLACRNRLLLLRRFAPRRVVPEAASMLTGVAGHCRHARWRAIAPALRGIADGLLGRAGVPQVGLLSPRVDPEWRGGLRLCP